MLNKKFLNWFISNECCLNNANDELLENKHDYIQHYFPLMEPSSCNPDAPVLSKEDIEFLKNNTAAQWNLCRNFYRMVEFYFTNCRGHFYGNDFVITINDSDGCTDLCHINRPSWVAKNNHNYLRITRILKCLMLFGQEDLAKGFLFALINLSNTDKRIIGRKTYEYWMKAVYE
jgi:hypothetical protein